MFCRSISWFGCIFVAAAIATGYSGEDSSTESVTVAPVEEAGPSTEAELGLLLDAREGAVVALVAGDTRLVVHRAVLAARSAVFRRALRDPGVREVTVPDVEGPALRQLAAYLYTLRAPQLPDTAPQLLAAADRFGLPALKAHCERQLIDQLSAETAAASAVLAVRHDCGSLREAAVAYIRAHIFHVMATQGWADVVKGQPDDWIKVVRLLSESPAEASSPAPTDSGTTPYPATQTLSGHSDRETPASAAPTTAAQTTAQTEDHYVSFLRSLSPEEKGRRLIQAAKQGSVGELEALLAPGADVGVRDQEDSYRFTALHWAAWLGQEEAARRLLAAGAPVDARDTDQWTPLHCAAQDGHAAVVRLLLAAGAAVDAQDTDQWTPLHRAAWEGHAAVVRLLLAAGAAVDARGTDQWTPLHRAAREGHAAVVRLLLAAGADHTDGKDDGWTPLHLAVANDYKQVATALLERGANKEATNSDGKTPLDLARTNNNTWLVHLLEAY